MGMHTTSRVCSTRHDLQGIVKKAASMEDAYVQGLWYPTLRQMFTADFGGEAQGRELPRPSTDFYRVLKIVLDLNGITQTNIQRTHQ